MQSAAPSAAGEFTRNMVQGPGTVCSPRYDVRVHRRCILALTVFSISAFAQSNTGDTHLKRALYLADLYNWAGAASDFEAAEHVFNAAGDQRSALLARLGRIRANVERDQRSLPVISADLADKIDTNPLLQTDKRLRLLAFIVKGDIDGEVETGAMRADWEQVKVLARELGDTKWEYRATGQLGIAAFYDGDNDTAAKNAGMALEAARQKGDIGAQIRFLTVLGFGLTESRMHEQALALFEQAIALANATPDSGYPFTSRAGLISALIGMNQLGRSQTATEETLQQARQEGRKAHEAAVLRLLARLQLAQGDRAGAMTTLMQALGIAETAGLLRLVGELQDVAAQAHLAAGDIDKAADFVAAASQSAQAAGDFSRVPEHLALLAGIRMKQGRYTDAGQIFETAEAIVDATVGKAYTVLNKTALVRAASDIYAQHFALVADHFNDPLKAYRIIEQVRGRVTRDVIASPIGTTGAAREVERSLARLRLKLMNARKPAEVKRVRDEIFLAEQARWSSPSITILNPRSIEPAELHEVQQLLPNRTVILEFVLADQRSYCLVISRRTAGIVSLAPKAEIERHVANFLGSVKRKERARAVARQLYRVLLEPVSEVAAAVNLIIVRDGVLHTVPFDALVGRAGEYVLTTKNITYTPSATAFYLLSTNPKRPVAAHAAMLGVGGVPYATSRLTRSALTRGRSQTEFADLPGSTAELHAASLAIRPSASKLLTGSQATETAFKASDLDRYRIIHLAVHSVADPAFPDHTAVVLLSDPGAGEDGLLHPPEIAHLNLNAELVILSACDTAVGPLQGQEGVANLSRAFLAAGARSVISTLWQIDDNASLFLMRRFYAHLAAQKPPEEALRRAKLEFIRRFGPAAVPSLWAGYTFEGAVTTVQ
jgi:CHAT domain-containing protein